MTTRINIATVSEALDAAMLRISALEARLEALEATPKAAPAKRYVPAPEQAARKAEFAAFAAFAREFAIKNGGCSAAEAEAAYKASLS